MSRINEIKIDGYSIYIEQLEQVDTSKNMHDAGNKKNLVFEWSSSGIEQMIKPVISIFNSLHKAAEDTLPNEIEFSMQFDIALKGETPVLKIVSAETSAQIGVKFVWNKDTVQL